MGLQSMTTKLSKNNSFQAHLVALIFINFMLLIPFMVVRAIAIIMLGILIYKHEQHLKMLVPASPGFVFWLGNFLHYIVGAIGLTILSDVSDDFGIRYLNDALLYIGIGFSFYIIGMWLAGEVQSPKTPSNAFIDLNLSKYSILLLSCIFFITTMIGGEGEGESGSDYGHSLYYNLIIGSIQSIESLPIIILAIYILKKNKTWWIALILFASRFVVASSGILIGYGRSVLVTAVIDILLTGCAIQFWRGIKLSNRLKMFLLASPFLVLVYFGIATSYRETVAFDSSLMVSERREILADSINSVNSSGNFIKDALHQICERLTESDGLELFGNAESGLVPYSGWSLNDLEQAAFIYIPKTWYTNKGVGIGRDIMVEYGFTVFNNIPPTLLGDSFRRSGLFGVIMIYFIMGFVATTMTINLNNRWGSFGPLLALYLGLKSFGLVSNDAMSVYNFYAYRIVSSGIIMYFLLRFSGILPKSTLNKSYHLAQLGNGNNRC